MVNSTGQQLGERLHIEWDDWARDLRDPCGFGENLQTLGDGSASDSGRWGSRCSCVADKDRQGNSCRVDDAASYSARLGKRILEKM